MSEVLTAKSKQESASKCPVWKITRFFNDLLNNLLSRIDKETELLDRMSFIALINLKDINWEEEIKNHRISYHLEWKELHHFFGIIWAMGTEHIKFTDKEKNLFIWMIKNNKEITDENYKVYFWTLIWTAMLDIFITIMLENNFQIEKKQCLRILLKNMQKWTKIQSRNDVLSQKIVYAISNDTENLVEKLTNLYEYKYRKTDDKESCLFMKSKEKVIWIEWMWELLEEEFLPNMKKLCKPISKADKESLFYLGRYNEIKK